SYAKIVQIGRSHDIGKNIVQRLRWDNIWQRELLVILGHAQVMQILRNLAAWNYLIQCLSIGQVATVLLGESTVARQHARDLPSAVGAEVEVDAAIVVADRGHQLAAIVHADKRNDKLIRHAAFV